MMIRIEKKYTSKFMTDHVLIRGRSLLVLKVDHEPFIMEFA